MPSRSFQIQKHRRPRNLFTAYDFLEKDQTTASTAQGLHLKQTASSETVMNPVDVVETKKALNSRGYYRRSAGEQREFSPATTHELFNGLRGFQADHGLKVDGLARRGGPTEEALNDPRTIAAFPILQNKPPSPRRLKALDTGHSEEKTIAPARNQKPSPTPAGRKRGFIPSGLVTVPGGPGWDLIGPVRRLRVVADRDTA